MCRAWLCLKAWAWPGHKMLHMSIQPVYTLALLSSSVVMEMPTMLLHHDSGSCSWNTLHPSQPLHPAMNTTAASRHHTTPEHTSTRLLQVDMYAAGVTGADIITALFHETVQVSWLEGQDHEHKVYNPCPEGDPVLHIICLVLQQPAAQRPGAGWVSDILECLLQCYELHKVRGDRFGLDYLLLREVWHVPA